PGPACERRLPVQLHPRFDNRRIVADHGAAGGVGPAAGHVDVVQRQLGVAAPVPVDAHGPGLHAAAADGAVVEVELVVAKPELPEPVLAHLRARQAAAVVPGAAARRPHRAGVAAAGVVTGGVDAVAAGEEV